MDFDDLRKLTEDDPDDIEFDDEISFEMGREIESPGSQRGGAVNGLIQSIAPAERAFLAVMVFLNVLVLGFGMLIATGRVAF